MDKRKKKKRRPKHCILGEDYIEEKCKDLECKFKELCKRMVRKD